MYRRIEIIHQMSPQIYKALQRRIKRRGGMLGNRVTRFWKSGLMGISYETVAAAWCSMNVPRRTIFKNCRFYFTEEGWRRYGRPAITACQRSGQEYRLIRIKEGSADVIYRDNFQVAIRPKKKRKRESTFSVSRRASEAVHFLSLQLK